MGANVEEDLLHVLADHIIPSHEIGVCLRHSVKEERTSGADTHLYQRMLPGGGSQARNVIEDRVLGGDGLYLGLHPQYIRLGSDAA